MRERTARQSIALSFAVAAVPATSWADFEVGNATFHGWVQFADETSPTVPLLVDPANPADGPSIALFGGFLAHSEVYRCTEGQDQTWITTVSLGTPTGFSVQKIRVNFSPDCTVTLHLNDALYLQEPDRDTLTLVAPFAGDPCRVDLLGPYSVSISYNGAPVSLAGTGMTEHPKVLSAGAIVTLEVSPSVVAPALANETVSPVGAHMASLGQPDLQIFQGAARPGGVAAVTATVRDARCVSVSLPRVAVEVSFLFKAGSGGHTPHQTADVSPVLSASIAAPLSVLDEVRPTTPAASFDAASGVLSGTTGPAGTLKADAKAGEVAGRVEVRASVNEAASPVFAPGASVSDPPAKDLIVAVTGLVPIQPQPGLYHLSGNRFTPPPLHTPGFGDNHDANHFIRPDLQQYVIGMAAYFQLAHPEFGLNIDDASLSTGGLFDLKGNYSYCSSATLNCTTGPGGGLAGHEYHRFGTDVDIRLEVFKFANASTPKWQKKKIMDAIQRYAESKGGVFAVEPSIHVRFP